MGQRQPATPASQQNPSPRRARKVLAKNMGRGYLQSFYVIFLLSKWPCKQRVVSTLAVHGIRSVIKEQWGRYAIRGMCLHCADKAEKRGGFWVTTRMGMGPRLLHSIVFLLPFSHSPHFPEWVAWRPELLPSFTLRVLCDQEHGLCSSTFQFSTHTELQQYVRIHA